jgi:hypothetical protein
MPGPPTVSAQTDSVTGYSLQGSLQDLQAITQVGMQDQLLQHACQQWRGTQQGCDCSQSGHQEVCQGSTAGCGCRSGIAYLCLRPPVTRGRQLAGQSVKQDVCAQAVWQGLGSKEPQGKPPHAHAGLLLCCQTKQAVPRSYQYNPMQQQKLQPIHFRSLHSGHTALCRQRQCD